LRSPSLRNRRAQAFTDDESFLFLKAETVQPSNEAAVILGKKRRVVNSKEQRLLKFNATPVSIGMLLLCALSLSKRQNIFQNFG
jgi:hypothetical protein